MAQEQVGTIVMPDVDLYDFRHAWAIRSIRRNSPTLAAKTMGHSLDVHHRTYHRWLDQNDIAAVAASLASIETTDLTTQVGVSRFLHPLCLFAFTLMATRLWWSAVLAFGLCCQTGFARHGSVAWNWLGGSTYGLVAALTVVDVLIAPRWSQT